MFVDNKYYKTPLEKPEAKAFFLRPLPCVTGTPPWLLRPEASTSSDLYPDTRLFFVNAQASSFLIHSHVTYGTPCHARGHSRSFFHPTFFTVSATDLRERFLHSGVFYLALLIPREAEDFSRGDRHFKHVPPPTYLICLSPKELYTVGSI